MLTCPLCNSRIPVDDQMMCAGDCQCARETMARKIISMQSVVLEARRDREAFCASADKTRELLAARVRHLERFVYDIYMDYHVSEIRDLPTSTRMAWEAGQSVFDAMRPNAKADLAPASGAQVQRLVGCEPSNGEKK